MVKKLALALKALAAGFALVWLEFAQAADLTPFPSCGCFQVSTMHVLTVLLEVGTLQIGGVWSSSPHFWCVIKLP